MKFLIIFVLASVLAVHGKPYGLGYGRPGSSVGYGGVNAGQSYGGSGFENAGQGYNNGRYQSGGAQNGYDQAHHTKTYQSSVQAQESDGYSRGGSSQYGAGGGQSSGFGGVNRGQTGYGQSGFNSGLRR